MSYIKVKVMNKEEVKTLDNEQLKKVSGGTTGLVSTDERIPSIDGVPSDDMAKIDVLKDAASAAIYGARIK